MSEPEFVKSDSGWWTWPWYRKVAAWLRYAPLRTAQGVVMVARQWAALRLGRRPPWCWVVTGRTDIRLGSSDEWHGAVADGCIEGKAIRHGLKYERSLGMIWDVTSEWGLEVGRTYLLELRPPSTSGTREP